MIDPAVFMGFLESFEGSHKPARHTRRLSLRREADCFDQSLTGEAPRPMRPPPAPASPPPMRPAQARAPQPVGWDDVDTYVEAVPIFPVGAPDRVDTTAQYVEMPAHAEAWVPNAEAGGS